MEILSVFMVIAGIVFLGFIGDLIFKKTNIPDVLILIILGILLGHTFLNWVNVESLGEGTKIFNTFALLFILFQGAINIDFKTLFKTLLNTTKLTVTNFVLTVLVVSCISYLIYQNWLYSILIGMILGGTSSAVVIPLVTNIDIKNKYGSVLTLESAISDVLCIVGTITILTILDSGNFIASSVFKTIFSSFSMALILGIISGVIWISLLHKFSDLSKSYMVTIAFVIFLYAFVEGPFVGASGAIAVLTFGLLLGNSKRILHIMHNSSSSKFSSPEEDPDAKVIRSVLSTNAKTFYSEISFFVKTFFFVYLGILMDFSNPLVFVYGALITIGVYLVRPFAVKFVFRKEKLNQKERTILEILVPKGLAAAVLAGLAVQSGLIEPIANQFVNTILSVVFISILMTSVLVFFTEKGKFKGLIPFIN